MKIFRVLIFGWLAAITIGHAQNVVITNAGWFTVAGLSALAITNDTTSDTNQTSNASPRIAAAATTTPPVIAEAITSDIQTLADGLQHDPVKIYNYVHDHIRHVLYFGSKKGAALTLLERSGNDFDQSALLVALLRAAGFSNASYQFGWVVMPYDNPDGSHQDLKHWLGLSLENTNWSVTADYLDDLFRAKRFYPTNVSNLGGNAFAFQRVWVKLPLGGTNYLLDPAFKVSERMPGINLPLATGFDSNNLMVAAGGVTTSYSVSNVDETAIAEQLKAGTTNLLNYLQSNAPNASVEEIASGWRIVPSTSTTLVTNLVFAATNLNGTMPVLEWVNQPTNFMSTMKISYGGTSYQCFVPELQGRRLSLQVFYGTPTSRAWLYLEDALVLQADVSGGFNLTWDVCHPSQNGGWDAVNNVFTPGNIHYAVDAAYSGSDSSYALTYVFEPDWNWLHQRQRVLENYRQQGYGDNSRTVIAETLNIMGLNWTLQLENETRLLGNQLGILPQFHHRFGRMAQESGKGYYVDVYMATTGAASGRSKTDSNFLRWFDLTGYFGSAMEHGLIEQLQSSNLTAFSTVKALAKANHDDFVGTNGFAHGIYLLNSANWNLLRPFLSSNWLFANQADNINNDINAGYTILVHANACVVDYLPPNLVGFFPASLRRNSNGIKMLIGSGFGGYVSSPSATVNPAFINQYSYAQPQFFSSVPAFTPNLTGADPVSMGDGAFQVEETDLSLGQTEPRGLNFSRFYSSNRRNSDLTGMGYGWVHNYYLKAASTSAPEAGLGGTTPAQMAAMLTANCAAMNFYDGEQPTAKNWLVTALIAKWGIDQLTGNAVTVTLGKDVIQFIRQPDGSYTPPANCTMSLTSTGTTNLVYTLQERHGRTFKFDGSGNCTNIADAYGQHLTLTYNTANLPQVVTDWKGRTLTFNYGDLNPPRLSSVADSAGRTVTFNRNNNILLSVADNAGTLGSYTYDANHQITATLNGRGQLVASNLYDSFGHVTTQYTQGDTNKIWRIFWSGWQTVSQDPAGGQTSYFYDDKTRLIGQSDALGNFSQSIYDGQDHVVKTVSPLNEVRQFIYDGRNNLVQSVDALGNSNQFVYDGNNTLVQAVDANGNPCTFGYNAQYSLAGVTNAAGDWQTYTYNTDGTLQSHTDAGGTTTYGYNANGQLINLTYPGGLGGESFGNNVLGDVTNHVDARGFATAFQYNSRRQLTNTIAPTNLTVRVAYDADGNQVKVTDARGNVASNTWSATRHLLKTTLPATVAGVATTTKVYDNRDWLVKTVDPLQRTALFTNDAAGRLIAVADPVQRTTLFGYDAAGRKLSVTNAAGTVTRQMFDARGSVVKSTDGAQHTALSAYDAAGNQITLTNRNGKKWQFQFDGVNRLVKTITPLNRQTVQTWNHQGLLQTVTDPANQTTSLFYDGKGRLTNRTDNVGTTRYAYDAGYNLTNVAAQSSSLSWSYDAYGRMTSHTDANGFQIQYRYDASGNLTNLIYPGGKKVFYFYNALNQLTNVTDWSGRKTSYTYDLAGQTTGIKWPNGCYRTINYDAAGQVTNILDQMSNTLPVVWFKFNWTNTGNLAWEFAAPLPHTVTMPTRTMTYDDDNRLATVNGVSVVSDANGNLTSAPLPGGNFASQIFDARNRLVSVGGSSYTTNSYDPAGNRIGVINGTNTAGFVFNPNTGLPQVLMRIKNGVTNYYVYGAGLLYQITETATATNTRTYHFDYRGSTVALTADNGQLTDRMEYSAYGLTTYRTGTSDTPFLFNGKYGVQTDANGLLYMSARYYNPYLCRFISSDPSGFAGGLNHYAYANGNPVSLVDPFGLGAIGEGGNSTWLHDQIFNELVSGPSMADQIENQNAAADFVNFITLGLANVGTTAITGHDLYGGDVSGRERIADAVMLASAIIPVAGIEASVGGRIASEVSSSVGELAAETTVVGESKLWSISEFNGTRVYQRNDLIDTTLVDARGRSNLERMQSGLAPIGPDGQSINLHHLIQTDDSPLAEMTATFHQENSSVIHINPNTIPSGIDRSAFDAFRRVYWINRAKGFSP